MKLFRVGVRTLHSMEAKFKQDLQKFEKCYPQIVRVLTQSEFPDIPQVNKRFARALDYNVPNGNKTKGMTVPLCYKSLEDPEKLTPEKEKLSYVLGWCVELSQASLLMQDDIIDNAVTRRKQPCWYSVEDVKMFAINDSVLVENSPFKLIKHYFHQDRYYNKYVEAYHETLWKLYLGQTLENVTYEESKNDVNVLTMDRYNLIVKYKAEPFAFLLPATVAIYLADKYDPKSYKQIKPILDKAGKLLQTHNDLMDVYGDPSHTGYVGTDILGGKCTWLIATAIDRANSNQKSVLQANYGKDDPKAVQTVIKVFNDLDIKGAYDDFETKELQEIKNQLKQLSEAGYPHKSFLKFLDEYYIKKNWQDREWWCS